MSATWDEVQTWMRERIAQGKQLSAEAYAFEAYLFFARPYRLDVLHTMAQAILREEGKRFWVEFPKSRAKLDELYHDDTFPERACDRCGQPYRGPAVYCSLRCALDDA